MAYKKDINLFKAAGGTVGKAKKMPLTKKLVIAMVMVVVIIGAVIGFLLYLQSGQNAELKKLKDQKDSYTFTKMITQSLLNEYKNVSGSKESLSIIEYYQELKSNMFSVLTEDELKTVKEYLNNNSYVTDYDFHAVCEGIRKKVLLAPYTIDSNIDDSAVLQENYKLIYSALTNMVEYESLYRDLPEQNERGIWYSYYRGQFLAVIEGGGDIGTLLNSLTDSSQLGISPFMNLTSDTLSGKETLNEACGITVNVEGVDYTIICITRKSNIERLVDIIENRIDIAYENDYAQTGVDYEYSLGALSITPDSNEIVFTIQVTQTEVFGLEEIAQAIDESAFFKAEKSLTFPWLDKEPTATAELKFVIENYAYDIMEETARSLFRVEEETEVEE